MATTDYLDVDSVLPPFQKYGLVTCVYDENDKTHFALKLRGAFETKEDAGKFCAKINQNTPPAMQTPMYVVELGAWLCMPPPSPEDITEAGGEEVYQEEYLQNLMRGYRENQDRKNAYFHQRKNELMQKPSFTNDTEDASEVTDTGASSSGVVSDGARAQLDAFEPVVSSTSPPSPSSLNHEPDDDRQLL